MRVLLAACLSAVIVGDARAHHGPYGRFSIDETIDFRGTVVAVEWINPHAFVLVRTELDGEEMTMRIELQGLRQLTDKGWHGDELKIGETVKVVNAAREIRDPSTLVCCARIYDLTGKEFYTDPRRSEPSLAGKLAE